MNRGNASGGEKKKEEEAGRNASARNLCLSIASFPFFLCVLCALSVLCVCLGSKAACLPAPRDGGDDASQRIEVARINDFAWRMRITQRPGDGHVDGSVAEKRGAVVAASGDAVLCRDVICPSQRHQAVHQLARGEI